MDQGVPDTSPLKPVEGEPVTTARSGTVCSSCAYDLKGQRVVNEHHYRMNVVTCPECAAVIPYGPRYRGRRAERRRAEVMSFLWISIVGTIVIGLGASIMALAQSTGYAASIPFAEQISMEHPPPERMIRIHGSIWDEIPTAWWEQNAARVTTAAGGWTRATDWIVLTDLLYYIPISIVFATLWRVMFMHTSRIVCALAMTLAFISGAIFLRVYFLVIAAEMLGTYRYSIHVAEDVVGWPIAWLSYAVGCVTFLSMLPIAGLALRLLATNVAPPSIRAKLWKFDPAFSR